MDFNFLFTYYTCAGTVSAFDIQKKANNSSSYPVAIIQYNNISEAEAVLNNILDGKIQPAFNILISPGQPAALNKKWFSLIISIISHATYNKFLGKQIIFFDEGKWLNAIDEFAKELKLLGFKNTIPLYLGKDNATSNEAFNFIFLRSLDDEKQLLERVATAMHSLSQPFQIIFHSSLIDSFPAIKEKLHQYIQQHYKQEELQLLKKIFDCNQQISLLQDTVLNKESLLISKQAYLDFLLNQYPSGDDNGIRLNEELKIRKFYHYEYEILPMWFKQLGHIIKVLMGKRSFRSLYDDKAPKYKD
jgi:hypothetical protein